MTETVKHTPAPWEWKDDDKDEFGNYRLSPGILATALPDGTPWGDDIDKANARLIAAAPDLLEALKNTLQIAEAYYSGTHSKWREFARAAIAKAETSS